MRKRHFIFSLLILLCVEDLVAQLRFFDNPSTMELARKGADHIYGMNYDSAVTYIDRVKGELPEHPLPDLMEGVHLLWQHLPVISDSVFTIFQGYMNRAIEKSQAIAKSDSDPEAIFFELAARGFMAEYYSDKEQYMKAFAEANKAYSLLKKGIEMTDEVNEFLFTAGLYNYFREKYPELYPVYRPLVWLFRDGDMEKGLDQLDIATRETIISRVEAHIFISYIYLRYEEQPEKAQQYLEYLVNRYPKNLYLITKYLESLKEDRFVELMPLPLINQLQQSEKPYFKLAGNVFRGLYEEKVNKNIRNAYSYFARGIDAGKALIYYGEVYKSLGYLGMGRILINSRPQTAKVYLQKAIKYAETKDVKKEAQALIRSANL